MTVLSTLPYATTHAYPILLYILSLKMVPILGRAFPYRVQYEVLPPPHPRYSHH